VLVLALDFGLDVELVLVFGPVVELVLGLALVQVNRFGVVVGFEVRLIRSGTC
jgi:hypothetical protein